MLSKDVQRYNDNKKSHVSSSTLINTKNPKEKKPSSKKVSFFNPISNPQKESKSKYLDNSKNINEEDSDDYNSILSSDSFDEDRESQLEIVNEKFQNLFVGNDKKYVNIIKEINAEKKLFFKKSLMSFNLLVLKIKCFIKLLKAKFVESLKMKEIYEFDHEIHKIKKEFKILFAFINEESKYEYEITTQVYAKFLYLMGIICTKKEEYIASFSYISLGVNILKVFFIRQGIAKDINTYQIYAKLVVILLNKLISDNNISEALIYISLLTRICEISLKLVSNNQAEIKYEHKFNKYQALGFLYLGFCYELSKKFPNNYQLALKAYKEAYYFMNKTIYKASIFSELSSIITIERKPFYLARILYEKITEKLNIDYVEKQKEYEYKEKLKKQKLEEARNEEKKYRLKLIASGVSPENPNLTKMQEKIFSEILTPNNQVLIDKLDDELISYVYRNKADKKEEKEETKREKKEDLELKESNKIPSMEIMKNLCHYKMYNNLLTDDYKEFLLNNRHLKFNNPQKTKNSLDKIQKYLNRKMEIDINNNTDSNKKNNNNNIKDNKSNKGKNANNKLTEKQSSQLILKTEIDTNNSYESNKIPNKIFKNINNNNYRNNKLNLEINKTSTEEPTISNTNNIISSQNKINLYKSYKNPNHTFIISKEKEKNLNKNLNNKISITSPNSANSDIIIKNDPKKKAFSNLKNLRIKTTEPENKKVDKFIFNKKYFREMTYFENLINKELFFQKIFLEQKGANAKSYFKGYQNELDSHGIVPREEIMNSFLILNDKATSRERDYEKEMRLEFELRNKPRVFGNMFKSVANKMKEGKKVRNAVGKVLDKYLLAQKRSKEKKKILFDKKNINKKNVDSILDFNQSIKEINFLLKTKKNEIKRIKKISHQENNLTNE